MFSLNTFKAKILISLPIHFQTQKSKYKPVHSTDSLARHSLRVGCILAHIALILLHLALLAILMKGHKEHAIVFESDTQSIVSPIITAVATVFGTVYFSILVFITQKLAMHRNMQRSRTLTALHDNASAWTGIGLAVSTLWSQISIPASVIGTMTVTGYLGSIAVLHITTPALFSVELFNTSFQRGIATQGIPELNKTASPNATIAFIQQNLVFLPWLSRLDQSQTLGLLNGTLYDVLDINPSNGNAQVSATSFNISCGFLRGKNIKYNGDWWNISLETPGSRSTDKVIFYGIDSTGGNLLQVLDSGVDNSIILYTTNSVMDSHNNTGYSLPIKPPMGPNSTISHLRFLQCSNSLIYQKAEVDCVSRQLVTLEKKVYKDHSAWRKYTPPANPSLDITSSLVGSNLWTQLLTEAPPTQIDYLFNSSNAQAFLSVVDVYLMSRLRLTPSWIKTPNVPYTMDTLQLHDIENSLSALVASLYWMAGNVQADGLSSKYAQLNGIIYPEGLNPEIPVPPVLKGGNTSITQLKSASRLDLSLLPVVVGLGTSVLLFILAFPFCFDTGGEKPQTDGMGVLQTIWLFRNHPDLDTLLPPTEIPTDTNLRSAGMVRVQLLSNSGTEKEN
ncbi:hypothetical protein DFH09DRAFT_271536 [Mycena vulgaris]|nr:hypothetical protein DFH09DRAFT_271536 [Mycena vulgaris]